MPQYPRNQADVLAQVDSMIADYLEPPDLFPSSDPDRLAALRENYLTASSKLTEAEALTKSAAKQKLACFTAVRQAMKDQIRCSQADTSGCPDYLTFIGWNSRRTGEPIDPPGSPTSLYIQPSDGDSLIFRWDKPDKNSGGPVGCYMIQVRLATGNMNNNPWRLLATTFETEYELPSADAGNISGRCEFRIIAANKAGQSCPSNTATVLLSVATEKASART